MLNSFQSLSDFLHAARRIALLAGDEILRHNGETTPVEKKANGSPVSAADRAAEDIIIHELNALTPDIPVISEEAYDRGAAPIVTGDWFWLVDPLDGSREFLKNRLDYCVNIALVEKGLPVLGVIHAPAHGVHYSGGVDMPAMRWSGVDTPTPIRARSQSDAGLVIVSSRSHGDEIYMEKYLTGRVIREHIYRASALKFCDVAEGRVDLYPRFGPSCEWDTAAGHAIVNAAGGSVTTPTNTPLLYGKDNFLNPDFIAKGVRE